MAVLLADEQVPGSVERHAGGGARERHGCGEQAVGRRLGDPPAIVVMMPSRSTLRTRSFELSAIRKCWSPSRRTSVGKLRKASVAGPPSPP
jgi:hypothetical protein